MGQNNHSGHWGINPPQKQHPLFLAKPRPPPLTLICINWVPGDPRTIFLVTSFTGKMPESSDSMYSSIFTLENI